MKLIIKLLITTGLVLVLAHFLPGVSVKSASTALIVAAVLAILDLILKPILIFLTIPATLVTLGLFLFVINAVIVLVAGYFVPGFTVSGFWTALLFSIILSCGQSILNKLFLNENN